MSTVGTGMRRSNRCRYRPSSRRPTRTSSALPTRRRRGVSSFWIFELVRLPPVLGLLPEWLALWLRHLLRPGLVPRPLLRLAPPPLLALALWPRPAPRL